MTTKVQVISPRAVKAGQFMMALAVGAAVLGGGYLALALWARAKASSHAAALLFHYSLAYLALVFIVGAVTAVVVG